MSRIVFLLWCLLPAAAQAAANIHEYRLANGLKLVVQEDHRAPVVVSQIWYKVGSSYEHNGITGISHVLEHMMFKGTRKHGPNEFSRLIAAAGGRENAFTADDYTAYFQRLEHSRLELAFELEADRMRNLVLDPVESAKETRVVMEERRMRVEDKPQSLTWEQFQATAFLANPYRIPTIGWMADLESLTPADLRAWYDQWYLPNNATLVVVGDVDADAVRELAERHFGPVRPGPVGVVKPQPEPRQRGERRIVVRAPAELPYLALGWKVPGLKTAPAPWQAYALRVLAGILDDGDSARLSRELVRGQAVAAAADADYSIYTRMDGLFTLDGVPANGHTVAELEAALRAQVERLKTEPVTPAELERVKAGVVAADVYQRDSSFYQAMRIGILESIGLGWPVMEDYVDRIQAVTERQVQAVARLYLRDEGLTVARLEPLPLETAGDEGGERHAR